MEYEQTLDFALEVLSEQVDWDEDVGDVIILDTEKNYALIVLVARQFKLEWHVVRDKLQALIEYQLTQPHPDQERIDHLVDLQRQEWSRDVP
jgi:hypothetical protein